MNRTVKNYEIRRVLGEGAMGMVYYAIDLTLQREAALKSLRPDLAQQQKVIDRFRAEAQTQAKLNHQNIAHIYEYFQFRAEHFMAMEFINGKTLSVMLQERGRLPFEEAGGYIVQALRGLAHAHRHRVIHRDVKPSNLMLNTDGVIKVTDFGIARVVGADRATRIGLLLGTYEYISPEAVEGKDTTELSDLYSTGIVLFELVTGQLPFTGESEYDLVNKHVEAERPSLRDFGLRDVPSEFEGIIKRAMDRNPRKRFKSADEMADALQTCLDRHRQRASGAPGGWRRWWGGPSSGAETTVTAAGTTATGLPGRADISTAIRRVEDLLERQLWEEADRVAEDCWRSHPNDPELADVRGRIQRQHQLYEQAIQQQVLLARDLLNRDLPEAALSVVKNALAQYPRASALLDVKRECSQRIELRRQRADEVAQIQKRVDELTAAGKYQEAADYVLERQEHSKHLGELALILGRVMQSRKEYERNQAILQVLSEARARAGRGSWQEALATLDQAIEKYARDSRLTGLRGDLQEEWRAEQIRQAVEAMIAEATALAESSPEDARQRIASGLDEFPENGRLKQELARLDGILEARRRKQSIATAVDLASKLRRELKWQEAVTVLDACRDRDGPDPKTDELRALLEAEYRAHQAILERYVTESRGLIESKAWEEAILTLSSAGRELPGERVLSEMLQEAHQGLANKRREETVARIKSEAEAHLGAQQFDTAIPLLLDAVSQYPEDPALSTVLSQAVGARDAFIAQQKVRTALDAATGHWERREYEPAIAALRRGLEEVRGSAELLGKLEEYETGWAAVRRQRELDEISGALEEGIRTGDLQAALQRAVEGASRYPGDRDVLELQARARAEQRRTEAGKALAEVLASGAELEKKESWAAAAEVYERALASYPETGPELRSRLDDARARELAARRAANLASVDSRFHSSLNSGLPDDAEQVLNQAAAEFADEPSFKTWQKELAEARRMAARAAAIREAVAAAQAFIDQQKFDDAERILTTTEQERGADGTLGSVRAALLEAQENYAGALESALKGVGEMIERRDFEGAIAAAEKEQARFPHEPRFRELARDAAERRDEENRQNHISQIRILLGNGALDHAGVLLRYARNNYPDDPAFQELDREFAEARHLQDAREAFSRQRPEIERLAQARKWARAKELVQPYLDIPQIQDEARRISARMDAEEADYAERTGVIDKQARELIGAERFEEAATLLEHASEEYPEAESFGTLLGQARSRREIASAARRLDETEHAVRDLARQNQLAEALALLDRALAERPGEARLRDLRAVVAASIQEQDSIAAIAAEVDRLAGHQRGADAERALIEGLRRFPKSGRLLDLRPVVDATRKAEWEREARRASRNRQALEIQRLIGQHQLRDASTALETLGREYGAEAGVELANQLDVARQADDQQVARFLAKVDRLRSARSWPQALALFQDLPPWTAEDSRVADLRELVSREAAKEDAAERPRATRAEVREWDYTAAVADGADRLAQPSAWDDNVQFTVFRPNVIPPEQWCILLAFAHLSDKAPDAPAEEPSPLQEVKRQVTAILGADAANYRDLREDSSQPIPKSGLLTFVPEMKGVEFNPPAHSFSWQKSVHRAQFELRAAQHLNGKAAKGRMMVFLGNIIIAEIGLSIKVDGSCSAATEFASVRETRYRKVFASYSHKDVAVVEELEDHARAYGDQYIRDVVHLSAGQVWNDELLKLIEAADLFQLFWSSNSMRSEFVAKEWRHAISLARNEFVRPVYWEEPRPQGPGLPPPELNRLHFQRIRVFHSAQAAAEEQETIAAIAEEVDRLAKQQRGADAERALNEGLRRFPSSVRLQELQPLVDGARKAELEREGRKLNRVRQAAEIQQFIDRHRYRDAAGALDALGRDYGAEAGTELAKKLELARKADEREIIRFLAKVDRLRSGRAWPEALALFQDLPAWMAEDSRVAGRRELASRAAEEEEAAAAAKQAAAAEAAAKEQEDLDAVADEVELLAKQQRGADAERALIGALRRFPRSGSLQQLKPLVEAARRAEWEREVREVNRKREAAEIERLIEQHELRSAAAALAALREEYGAEAGAELAQQLELAGQADQREVGLILAKVDRLRSEKAWSQIPALFQDLPSWMAEDSRIADRRDLVTHEAERSVAWYLALAREKQQAGDSEDALAELERGLGEHPGEPRLLQFSATVRKTIEDLERQRDEFIASCLDQASKLRGGGNIEAALAQVEQGLSSYPEAGNLREMETRLREALEISLSKRASDVRACLAEAHELEAGGQLDEALSRVEKALSLYPGERELTQLQNRLQRAAQEARRKTDEFVARVRELEAAGDPEGALRCVEQALALYPNEPRLLQLSAAAKNAIQEKARAREESITWYENQARKLRDAGDLEGALEQIEQGLASYPQEARLKELDRLLIQEIEESRRKRDDLVSRCTAEARKYQESGDFRAALAKVEEGLAVYPDDARLLPIAANLRKTLQDIRRKRDEFIALCTARARELQETGNPQDALAEVERGLASYPGDNRLAQLRVVLKKAIDEALRRKEETIARLLKQAHTLQQSGSLKGALAQIEQGLAAYPGEARLREMELALHEAVEERRRKRDEIVLGCLARVRELQAAGDLNNALARVREGLAACPDDPRLLEAATRLQKLLADELRKREESIATCLAETRQLQASGDLEGAMDRVRQGLAAYPNDDRLRKLRDALQAALQEAIQRREEFVSRCTRETQELELAGDLKGALVQIDQALTFYPGDPKLVELHATLVQNYEEYRRKQDGLVIQSLMRARRLEAKGDLESALEEIDRSLAAYPAEPRLVQARTALQARLQTVWYRRPVVYVPAAAVIVVAALVALFLPKAAIDVQHSPAVLAFPSYRIGSAVPPASLEIVWQNPGIPFTTLVSGPWITVTPDKGQRLDRMQVSVNPAALRAGSLKGTVTVQAASSARVSGNLVVPVTIDVESAEAGSKSTQNEAEPALKVDLSSLYFQYQIGGPLPDHAQIRALQGRIVKCTPSGEWLKARQTGAVCDVWAEPGKRPAGSYTATLLLKGAAGNDVRVSASLNITAAPGPPSSPPPRIPGEAYNGKPEGDCTWIGTLKGGEEIWLDPTGSKVLLGAPSWVRVPGRSVPYVELSALEIRSSTPLVKVDPQPDRIVVRNTGSTAVNQFTIHWRVKQ